jgi:predicted Fe-Mo cluster-binding NifX family protein
MIITIALNENHSKALVDEHFGRCACFCIYDSEKQKSEYIENTNRNANEGAGCRSAEMLMQYGIQIAIAGRFGVKVVEYFRKNDVQMIIPETQKNLEEIIKMFKIKK